MGDGAPVAGGVLSQTSRHRSSVAASSCRRRVRVRGARCGRVGSDRRHDLPAPARVCAELLQRFASVSDGRRDQGRVHPVAVVLALCAAAVVADMASFTAITGSAGDVPAELLVKLYGPSRAADPTRVGTVAHPQPQGDLPPVDHAASDGARRRRTHHQLPPRARPLPVTTPCRAGSGTASLHRPRAPRACLSRVRGQLTSTVLRGPGAAMRRGYPTEPCAGR